MDGVPCPGVSSPEPEPSPRLRALPGELGGLEALLLGLRRDELAALGVRAPAPSPLPAEHARDEAVLVRGARASEALAARVLETVPGGVVVISLQGAVLAANAEAVRFLGLDYDALTRRYITDFAAETFHEDGSPCPAEDYPVARCLASGRPDGPAVVGVRQRTGEVRWAVFRAVPLHDPEGGARLGAVVTFLDVTAERDAVAALRRADERYRTLLRHLPDLVLMVDPAGVVLEASRGGEGWSVEAAVGRPCFELIGPAERPPLEAALAAALAGGRAVDYETCSPAGRTHQVRVVPAQDVHGGPVALLLVSDVTDARATEARRRALDERLQAAQRLEGLALLAGGLAHDFNNLLAGILGNVELAARRTADETSRELLEGARHAARRASDLTQQLLAYAGRGRIAQEPIDLRALAADVLHLLRATAGKGVALQLEPGPVVPAVLGDPTQVRQVLMNLVTNAAEALEGGGEVRVAVEACPRERVAAEATHLPGVLEAETFVAVTVTDAGRGMDATTCARIFDPFFTTKLTGRGLGLAAVLGIVRGHRGAVSVRSDAGKGSRFRVYFPALAERVRAADPCEGLTAGAPAGGRPRGLVLVVDDEPYVRRVARLTLESDGWEVVEAPHGRAAVDIVRERGAGLAFVLLDLLMPGLDGEETAVLLRELRPDLPIVLSTGFAAERAAERIPGLAGVLRKPYGVDDLLALAARVGADARAPGDLAGAGRGPGPGAGA